MRSIYYLLFVLVSFSVDAQNIVPNPGFAQFTGCPYLAGEITKATGWNTPNIGTPDYYHKCNDTVTAVASHLFSAPATSMGYQASADSALTGWFAYVGTGVDIREYLTRSIPPLVPGAKYKVTTYVSLADSSKYGVNGFGVFFYINAKPDSVMFFSVIPVTPQIDYNSYGPITNKTAWTALTDTFVADSAYTHMVIGNFKSDAALTLVLDPAASGVYGNMSYYFTDSVSIERIQTTGIEEIDARLEATLYPNPFSDNCELQIRNLVGTPCTFTLYNVQGQLVRTVDNISTGKMILDRNNLAPGLYYYQLVAAGTAAVNGKVTIR